MAFAARRRTFTALAISTALCLASFARAAAAADSVVQIPVDSVLDGRTVSTLNGQAIVSWSAAQGIDGDGYADGFVTTAVEAMLQKQGKTENGVLGIALPDDGKFPATTRHPEIDLHFSNTAANTAPQTHQLHLSTGPQTFTFNVPQATYSKLFLLITCSEGPAALTITLTYAGGAAPVVTKLTLPDYGVGGAPANDQVFFNLIQGMHKWDTTNKENDGPSHTITGIEMNPSTTGELVSVQVTKTNGSHVVFWGATGVATSPVTTGTGGTGGTGGASAGGASGAGGVMVTAGAGGNAGSVSASGAPSAGASAAGTGGSGVSGSTSSGTAGTDSEVTSTDSSSGCSFLGSHAFSTRELPAWAVLVALCGVAWRRRRS